MKAWRNLQKVAVAVGMTYGLWLGCNIDATSKDGVNAFVIVMLAVVVALSLCFDDSKREKSL